MGFFFLVFYLIPLIVAMWVFFDSQKHGYTFWQGLLWAIGVFFVLIVFLPLYFFSRRKRRKLAPAPQRPQTPSQGTPCFYCGQPNQGDPKTCPHCGQNLKIRQ
ncbi:MAG: hypothetical protein HXY45_23025 [Syntrophaceae bacterium]|nr:hypothetical protein [Syntrophaceae bacterium]